MKRNWRFRIYGLGVFRAFGVLGFRVVGFEGSGVSGSGCSGFQVWGFWVLGSGCGIRGLGVEMRSLYLSKSQNLCHSLVLGGSSSRFLKGFLKGFYKGSMGV